MSNQPIQTGDFIAATTKVDENGDTVALEITNKSKPSQFSHTYGTIITTEEKNYTLYEQNNNFIILDNLNIYNFPRTPQTGTQVILLKSQDKLKNTFTNQDSAFGGTVDSQSHEIIINNLKANIKTVKVAKNLQILNNILKELIEAELSSLTSANSIIDFDSMDAKHIRKAIDEKLNSNLLINIKGRITGIDQAAKTVTIRPNMGTPFLLSYDDKTTFLFNDNTIKFDTSNMGNLVTGSYNSKTKVLENLILHLPYLKEESINILNTQLTETELTGKLTRIDLSFTPYLLSIQLPNKNSIFMKASDTTKIRKNGLKISIAELVPLTNIVVSYNATNDHINEIDILDDIPSSMSYVSGILTSINKKESRLSINNKTELIINQQTTITKNGNMLPISSLSLGDIIRPSTHYNTEDKSIKRLSVKASTLETITGKITGKFNIDNKNYVSIVTPKGTFLTFHITTISKLKEGMKTIVFDQIIPGNIAETIYDPITFDIEQLIIK